MRRILTVALLALIVTATTAEGRCRKPRDALLEAKSPRALVWSTERELHDGEARRFQFFACLRSSRSPTLLAEGEEFFAGSDGILSDFRLAGRFVAFDETASNDRAGETSHRLCVIDLRSLARVISEPLDRRPAQTVLSTRGELGLIVDREQRSEIWVRSPGRPAAILDRAAPGELSALKVYGGVAYWLHGAEGRSAPLP